MDINGSKVVRTYRVGADGWRLHVTADCRVWLDCGTGNASHAGTLAGDERITKANARRAANA